MNVTESIKFNKLQEENEKLKQEIAEKDKLINTFVETTALEKLHHHLLIIQSKNNELQKLKQQQLFKEDFYLLCEEDGFTYDWESLQTDEVTIEMHLKYYESNNHRYCLIKDIDDLPSNLESKCEK